MPALDEVVDETGIVSELVKETFNSLMWKWYYAHKDETVRISIWIIRTSIKIEQLYPLFVRLFGEDSPVTNG